MLIMLKKRKDGSVYYYYYKKKVGRHKKRGRKPTHTYSFYYKYTKKYANKYDFALYDSENYQYCKEQGWLDKLYPYVCRYTKRECKELCKVYSNSDELKEKNVGLYECIEKHNWLSDIFPKCQERYTKTNSYKEALKYKTYKEFKHGSPSIYRYCSRHELLKSYSWLKDDRIKIFEDKIDCVYMYMFSGMNAVYIGRTLYSRLNTRHNEHISDCNDSVNKFAIENNIHIPDITLLEKDLTILEGLEKEDYYINYYRELGYNILNKAKTGIGSGSIGSLNSGKWNKKTCYDAALTCDTVSEFRKKYDAAHRKAKQHDWIKEYTWFKEKPKYDYWTFDKCKEIADTCNSRKEFFNKNRGAYSASYTNNWLNDFFNNKKNNGYTYMKAKKIYKIEPSTMKIVGEYSKVKDITSDVHIYRVLSGEKNVYDDGYIYRKDFDIEIDQNTGKVVDKLCAKTKDEKMYIKYDYVINLLKNTSLSLSEICRESNLHGCKISEPTCRMLKEKYCGNLD